MRPDASDNKDCYQLTDIQHKHFLLHSSSECISLCDGLTISRALGGFIVHLTVLQGTLKTLANSLLSNATS